MSLSPSRARTRLVSVAVPLLALVLGLAVGPSPTADARPAPASKVAARATGVLQEDAVRDAVSWLHGRVGRTTHLVTAPPHRVKVRVATGPGRKARWVRRAKPGPAYPGLSIDVVLALRRLDPGGAVQAAMVKALEDVSSRYVSYRFGPLQGRYAEATARMLYVAATSGIPVRRFGDGTLRRTMVRMTHLEAGDPQRGRVVDTGWGGDTSSTVSQAAAVQALAAVDSKHLPVVARFLAKQACPAGHFRLVMDSPDYTCKGSNELRNRVANVDATAVAILALRTARAHGVRHLSDEIAAASSWLARRVQPNGGVFDDPYDAHVNARSTALAALALKATGRLGPAGNAAAWLLRNQVDARMVERHPVLKGQLGAVALDRASLLRAQREGITRGQRKAWVQSTALGAPGLTALLPARRLSVHAANSTSGFVVTVSGLVVGERYVVKRNGKTVSAGKAGPLGKLRLVLPRARKGTTIQAWGNRKVRTGVTVVSRR